MISIASETFTSVSAPIQYASIRAFEKNDEIESHVHNEKRILSALGNECACLLQKENISVLPPQGGFYLFPDFNTHKEKLKKRGIFGSTTLCERLLEDTGVAVLPGSCFGQKEENLTMRLSYVHFDGTSALVHAGKIPFGQRLENSFIQSYCKPTLNAIHHITS